MGVFSGPDVEALAEKKDVHGLVDLLDYKSGSPKREHVAVRREAVKALAGSASENAVQALIVAMHEDVLDVAAPAADALVRCGKPAAEALSKDMETEGPDQARKTSAVLAKIGAKAIGPLLAAFPKAGDVGRDRILSVLEQIDQRDVLAALHKAMAASAPARRAAAAEILGRLGDDRSVEVLARALQRDESPSVRVEAARGLGRIGTAAAAAPLLDGLSDPSDDVREAVSEAVEAVGEPAILPLVSIATSGPAETRFLALTTLAEMGASQAEGLFAEHMQSDQTALRLVAALGLSRCDTFGARQAITAGLDDANPQVRLVAARALLASDAAGSDAGRAADVERTAHMAVTEPLRSDDPERAAAVVELLEELARPEDARALMDGLSRKGLSSLHVRIMEALGRIGDPGSAGLLASRLAAKDRSIREAAARALIAMKDPVVVNRVLKALRGMSGSEAKEALASSVLASFGVHAREALIAALGGDPVVVRRVAARTLGEIRDDRSLDALILALRDEDGTVREWAARSLRHMGEPRGLDALEKAGVVERMVKGEKKKAKKARQKVLEGRVATVLSIAFFLVVAAGFVAAAWQLLEARSHPGLSPGEDLGAFIAGGLLGLLFTAIGAVAPTVLPLLVIGGLLPEKGKAGQAAKARKTAEHAVQCLLWVAVFLLLAFAFEKLLLDEEALRGYADKAWHSTQTEDGTSWSNDAAFGLSLHVAEIILAAAACILAVVGAFTSLKALFRTGLNRDGAVVGGSVALTAVLGVVLVPLLVEKVEADVERGLAVANLDADDDVQKAKAAATLFARGDERAVSRLAQALGSPDRTARLGALSALTERPCPPALLPGVAKLVVDDDEAVQAKALAAMAKAGPGALAHLGPYLTDDRARERLLALLDRQGPALDVFLVQALQDKKTATAAAQVLGKRKGDLAVNALTLALDSRDHTHRHPDFRVAAIRSLVEIGDPAAVPALAREVRNPKSVPSAAEAVKGLASLTPWTDETREALVDAAVGYRRAEIADQAAEALVKAGGAKAVPLLVKRLGGNNHRASSRAAAILARLGDPAVPALRNVLESDNRQAMPYACYALGFATDARSLSDLLKLLDSRNYAVLREAARALKRRKDPRALPALTAKLDKRYVRDIVGAYGAEAVPRLLEAMKSGDRGVRKVAFDLLAENPDERALPHFVRSLADRSLRGKAAKALATLGRPAVPALLEAFAEGDKVVKYWACRALAGINDPRKVEPLRRALGHEESLVRQGAAAALASTSAPDRLVEPLAKLLEDGDRGVRQAAIRALAGQKDPRAAKALVALFSRRDWSTRRKASEAVALLGELAVDPLTRELASSEDARRWCAMRALADMRNPRLTHLLRRGLRDPHKPVQRVAVDGLRSLEWKPVALLEKVDWAVASRSWNRLKNLGANESVWPMVTARLELGCEDDLPFLVEVLGHWRAKRAAPLLLPLLGRETGSLRVPVEAAKALGKMGERRAIEPLIGLLSHRAAIVRRAAYQALRDITGQFHGPNKAAWQAWWAEEKTEKK